MTPESIDPLGSPPSQPSRVYSAQLDDSMCPACAAHAGIEYPADGLLTPTIPNPSCMHPEGCRCTWL
jgi:hypothetical protein